MSPDGLLKFYSDRFVGIDDLVIAFTGDVSSSRVRELAKQLQGATLHGQNATTRGSIADLRITDGPPRSEGSPRTLVAESGLRVSTSNLAPNCRPSWSHRRIS